MNLQVRYAEQEDCVFCEKAAAILTEHYRGDLREVVDFEPLNPVTPGHRLFVPTVHVVDAADVPEIAGVVMLHAARWARTRGEQFNLITSGGSDASQTVFHLHAHYVPRHASDGLSLPWTEHA